MDWLPTVPGSPRRPRSAALVALGDERAQQFRDLLLAGGGRVELATHLGEPTLDRGEPGVEVRAEVGQVLAHRVEAGRRSLTEVADLAADLLDIAVGSPSEHASGGRVLGAVLGLLGQLPNPGLHG